MLLQIHSKRFDSDSLMEDIIKMLDWKVSVYQNKLRTNKQDKDAVMEQFKAKVTKNLNQISHARFKSDEARQAYEERIAQKVRSGKKLSSSEMNYLQMHNPELYHLARRIQMMRKAVESQLKNCKSKEEVARIVSDTINMIGTKDPDKEALINSVIDAEKEFKKSAAYKALPTSEEEAKEKGRLKREDYCLDNQMKRLGEAEETEYFMPLGQYQEAYVEESPMMSLDVKS